LPDVPSSTPEMRRSLKMKQYTIDYLATTVLGTIDPTGDSDYADFQPATMDPVERRARSEAAVAVDRDGEGRDSWAAAGAGRSEPRVGRFDPAGGRTSTPGGGW
jgi:hypothetical protein